MSTTWYYADAAGLQQGPIDAETLLARYAGGEIHAGSLVWREGLADWQPLSTVAHELGLTGIEAAAATTAIVPAATVVYAGFWRRFAARMIDSLVLGLLTVPITLTALLIAAAVGDAGKAAPLLVLGVQLALQVFSFVTTVAYFSFFHASRWMASPGKLAVGIKVVRGDGSRLGWGRSIGRGFAYYLSVLTLYAGFLLAAFTQRKQGLHDLVCDTLVVDRWAFTSTPERQKRGLDTVTIVVLALYGLLLLAILGALAFALVMAPASAGR